MELEFKKYPKLTNHYNIIKEPIFDNRMGELYYSDEDYDDYCEAEIRNYEEFELYKAKDILYTIIKMIKKLK